MPFGPLKAFTDPLKDAFNFATDLFGTSAKELTAGTMSYKGGKEARDLQIAQAMNQMAFQEASSARQFGRIQDLSQLQYDRTRDLATTAYERSKFLSDTAYQRAMRDMKLAGLNPILAYKQGGASTPSIGMGSVGLGSPGLQAGAMAPVQDIMTPAIKTATDVARTQAQVKQMNQAILESKQKVKESISKTGLNEKEQKLVDASIDKTYQEIINLDLMEKIRRQEITLNEAEIIIRNTVRDKYQKFGGEGIYDLPTGVSLKLSELLQWASGEIIEGFKNASGKIFGKFFGE